MNNVLNVPYINQMPKWPTGCESVTTVMLLRYLGIDISVDDFIACLPTAPLTGEGDARCGETPHKCFIGTPYDDESFGCYAAVIAQALTRCAEKYHLALTVTDLSSLSTEEMMASYVRKGQPVIYWATIDLRPSRVGPSWTLPDGDTFTWISNEHCMLLVGESGEDYVFNDPWNNNGVIRYPKALVEQRHGEMLSMALAVTKQP